MQQEDFNLMDARLFDPKTPLLGKFCGACGLGLYFTHFQKDASIKDGHSHICNSCRAEPCLSISEHIARKKEQNFNSEHARKLRGENPESWMGAGRIGNQKSCYDFLRELAALCPDLVIVEGNVSDTGQRDDADLMLYRAYPCPQKHLEGRDFASVGYINRGVLPEFSIFAFGKMGERDHEIKRGWRTILLRCIQLGMLSEETAEKKFGKVEGPAGEQYRKQLFAVRNRR
jgi:hypothetical protein